MGYICTLTVQSCAACFDFAVFHPDANHSDDGNPLCAKCAGLSWHERFSLIGELPDVDDPPRRRRSDNAPMLYSASGVCVRLQM